MNPLQFVVPLGFLESVAPALPAIILVLILASMVTRVLAHRSYVSQADDEAESLSRYTPHSVVLVLLLLSSFLYMVVHPHGGMVMSVLVLGVFLADFFEFESRQVEVRNGMTVERPKSAIAASVLALLYAAFQSLFFLVQPFWNQIV